MNFSAILHETRSAPSMPQEPGMILDLIGVHDLFANIWRSANLAFEPSHPAYRAALSPAMRRRE